MTPENETSGLDLNINEKMVLGEPLKVENLTLIPVIAITAGYGKTSGENIGGGYFSLNPVAIVTLHNGMMQVYSLQKQWPVDELTAEYSEPNITGEEADTP